MKKMARLSKRVRYAKVGDTVIVPLGMVYPHAVLLDKVYTDEDGQICGDGHIVSMDGCSDWRIGEFVSVCLGWAS